MVGKFLRADPAAVRGRIAGSWLVPREAAISLGSVPLKQHQREGVALLSRAINEFGGALLCDEVGVGKTHVAAALATRCQNTLIAAPASLRPMWRQVIATAGLRASFISIESLSRHPFFTGPFDFVIVDEAHHLRNPRTIRYRNAAAMIGPRPVVLLTATPLHNCVADLNALLALFLGTKAESLTIAELGRCVVRRTAEHISQAESFPEVHHGCWAPVPDCSRLTELLLSLPPPVPASDGGDGGMLVSHAFIRQWCSSDWALTMAVKRRLAQSYALIESLESGRYPTAGELRGWVFAEDSLQLGFPQLLSAIHTTAGSRLLGCIQAHRDALLEVRALLRSCDGDDARVSRVRTLRTAHAGARMIAFSAYAATVEMYFRHLAPDGDVALLTSRGTRVTGGRMGRHTILAQFDSTGRSDIPAERISLLLATDVLSEGVNMQGGCAVIHLDIPWTAARLSQRTGRIARMGSRHRRVAVYGLLPPVSAERALKNIDIVQRKAALAAKHTGTDRLAVNPRARLGQVLSPPEAAQRVRDIVGSWGAPRVQDSAPLYSGIRAPSPGFLAAVRVDDIVHLIGSFGETLTEDSCMLAALATLAAGEACAVPGGLLDATVASIEGWLDHNVAADILGLSTPAAHQTRRRILRKIAAVVEASAPHLRPALVEVAARASLAASAIMSAAEETELEQLVNADMPAKTWLSSIAALGRTPQSKGTSFPVRPCIEAILLFVPET